MTRKIIYIWLLVCYLLFAQVGICTAATYQMTEQELIQLEQIFAKLESNSTQQESQLQQQKLQLQSLNKQLTQAESSIRTAQNSLQQANQSLEQYARETRKIKTQRTVAYCTALAGLLYAVFKK